MPGSGDRESAAAVVPSGSGAVAKIATAPAGQEPDAEPIAGRNGRAGHPATPQRDKQAPQLLDSRSAGCGTSLTSHPTQDAIDPIRIDHGADERGSESTGDRALGHGTAGSRRDAMPPDRTGGDGASSTDTGRAGAEANILEVACFGAHPRLLFNGRQITLSRPKAVELLVFCAAQPPGPLDREMVLQLVWPDRREDDEDGEVMNGEDEETKRKRLRTTIWRLKGDLAEHGVALPRPPLRAERDGTISLDTELIRSDVHRFVTLCDRATERRNPPPPLDGTDGVVAACREAFALLASGGPGERRLLGGSGYRWLDVYWRGVKLEDHLRRRLRHAIDRVGARCLDEGRHETALELLQPLFEEDHTDQEVARRLLTAYGRLGDRASILHVDRVLRRALKRTLLDGLTAREKVGISEEAYEPARETRLLVERLLDDRRGVAGSVPAEVAMVAEHRLP